MNTPKVGQEIDVRTCNGLRAYLGIVLSVSPTGSRIVLQHPRYATGKATFYRTGTSSTYRESYGGTSMLNDHFTAV